MLNKESFSKYLRPLSPIPTHLSRRGALKGKMRGLLFDVYGTLFISGSGDTGTLSAEGKTEALQQLLHDYRISDSVAAVHDAFVNAVRSRHERLKQRGIDYPEIRIQDIWRQVTGISNMENVQAFALAYELILNPVFPMPHLEELLKAGREKGLPMGIISNAQFYTPLLFEWFMNRDLVSLGFQRDLLIFSYRFARAKPSLLLFDLARKRLQGLGVSPEQVLYVGNDMRNDIMPAQKVGFSSALFAGDARSLRLRQDDPACAQTRPDLFITDLIQLLDHV